MAEGKDFEKYMKDDAGDLVKGFMVALILCVVAGVLAWVTCIGYFTVLLLPFFAGYICGYFVEDMGKSIIVAGFGAFTGTLVGGFIAVFGLNLLEYEYYVGTVIFTMFILAIISLGAGAFGGYVKSSFEKSKIKPA